MAKRLHLVVLALFLVAGLAFGQNANSRNTAATIVGSVFVPTGQSIDRFDVILFSKDSEQEIARTYTDMTGRYTFANLFPSTVDVVVRLQGFEESRVTVNLSPGKVSSVNMILTAAANTAIARPWDSNIVSIEELSRKYPRKAVDDFQKALDAKQKGDVQKATELLEGVVRIAAKFSDAHNLLGIVYQGANRYRDAEKHYNTARDLSPHSVTPLINLATLYLQEAEASSQEGPFVTGVMYDDCLHVLQDAAKIDAHNANIYYLLGVTFYRSRSYRIAEASFNEALAIDGRMGPVRLALANIFMIEQKWKEALDQFDQYLADNPKAADRAQIEAIRSKVILQL